MKESVRVERGWDWEREAWELAGSSVAMYGSSGPTSFFPFSLTPFFPLHLPLSTLVVLSLAFASFLPFPSLAPLFTSSSLPLSFLLLPPPVGVHLTLTFTLLYIYRSAFSHWEVRINSAENLAVFFFSCLLTHTTRRLLLQSHTICYVHVIDPSVELVSIVIITTCWQKITITAGSVKVL